MVTRAGWPIALKTSAGAEVVEGSLAAGTRDMLNTISQNCEIVYTQFPQGAAGPDAKSLAKRSIEVQTL